jgi:hypothetical protein
VATLSENPLHLQRKATTGLTLIVQSISEYRLALAATGKNIQTCFVPGSPEVGGPRLLSTMDIRNDERHRCGTLIFDPVRSRAEFGEYLAGAKLLCRSIVMVIGQDP